MAKPNPSRTYNPLHFEDLEPHRFEDMVRQLIYDFREWSDIQAVGRTGSDRGVDIRAIERIREVIDLEEDPDEADSEPRGISEEREWIFQCKRYNQLGPKKVIAIAREDLNQQAEIPYGYVLVASCDFSSAAREGFRREMVERGVTEFYLWGKAELEDRLYQPKNDHLLFAYFGISLQAKKRTQRTSLRADLTLKRKLAKVLGTVNEAHSTPVLIRDPRDATYPHLAEKVSSPEQLPWNYWNFWQHLTPNGLLFEITAIYAYANWETEEWDADKSSHIDSGSCINLYPFKHDGMPENWSNSSEYTERYNAAIPKENQALLYIYGIIPFERILLIDEVGDMHNEAPHLLIDYLPGTTLVDKTFGEGPRHARIEGMHSRWYNFSVELPKKIEVFPLEVDKPVTDEISVEEKIL